MPADLSRRSARIGESAPAVSQIIPTSLFGSSGLAAGIPSPPPRPAGRGGPGRLGKDCWRPWGAWATVLADSPGSKPAAVAAQLFTLVARSRWADSCVRARRRCTPRPRSMLLVSSSPLAHGGDPGRRLACAGAVPSHDIQAPGGAGRTWCSDTLQAQSSAKWNGGPLGVRGQHGRPIASGCLEVRQRRGHPGLAWGRITPAELREDEEGEPIASWTCAISSISRPIPAPCPARCASTRRSWLIGTPRSPAIATSSSTAPDRAKPRAPVWRSCSGAGGSRACGRWPAASWDGATPAFRWRESSASGEGEVPAHAGGDEAVGHDVGGVDVGVEAGCAQAVKYANRISPAHMNRIRRDDHPTPCPRSAAEVPGCAQEEASGRGAPCPAG